MDEQCFAPVSAHTVCSVQKDETSGEPCLRDPPAKAKKSLSASQESSQGSPVGRLHHEGGAAGANQASG